LLHGQKNFPLERAAKALKIWRAHHHVRNSGKGTEVFMEKNKRQMPFYDNSQFYSLPTYYDNC